MAAAQRHEVPRHLLAHKNPVSTAGPGSTSTGWVGALLTVAGMAVFAAWVELEQRSRLLKPAARPL